MNRPRFLIVEDEALVAMALEELLDVMGYGAELCATNAAALEVLDEVAIDAALVDLNLAAGDSAPTVQALQARRIPFAILSGSQSPLPPGFGSPLRLTKPAFSASLSVICTALLQARTSGAGPDGCADAAPQTGTDG